MATPIAARLLLTLSLAASLTLSSGQPLWASEGLSRQVSVEAALKALDPQVKVRDDAWVHFANGEDYVLVTPQAPQPGPDLKVTEQLPAGKNPPDLILLSDGHALVRILTLADGQKTFPLISPMPEALQNGLLPQNFTFPEGFFFTTPWKALSGNLLTETPQAQATPAITVQPLLMSSPSRNSVLVWNPATAQIDKTLPLPCPEPSLALSGDNQTLFIGCHDQPLLVQMALATGTETHRYPLPFPVQGLALDNKHQRLFVSHTGNRKLLSVLDIAGKRALDPIETRFPVGPMVLSEFRAKLFATSLIPTEEKPVETPQKRGIKDFFFHPLRLEKANAQEKTPLKPGLQIINTATRQMERIVPSLPDIQQLYIQDDKMLWMFSPTSQALQAFDLRWQEFSEVLTFTETPADFASDGTWLYVLLSQRESLARLNSHTLTWASPIALEPGSRGQSVVLDPAEKQLFVFASHPDGLQVINLNRAEWVGTQRTDFSTQGPILSFSPRGGNPAERVRIQFQDGRLLPQTGQGLPWEKWLSGLRDLQKSQTPPEPAKTP